MKMNVVIDRAGKEARFFFRSMAERLQTTEKFVEQSLIYSLSPSSNTTFGILE